MSAPVPGASVRAVIALGANLGERGATLLAAARALAEADGVELVAVSPLFESAAVKLQGVDPSAPEYLNGVALIETTLSPRLLLELVNSIEAGHGRTRMVRWGDRTLDLDIIDYDGLQSETRRLTLPHPRAAERDFVLVPWLRVDPDATLPGRGRVDELVKALQVTVVEHARSVAVADSDSRATANSESGASASAPTAIDLSLDQGGRA